ncbi:MAG: hypothetical protein H6963_13845 [Chromatiaceae bacterium]|nr:hypothetical protein [Chromatiaceae bacterium]
MNTEIKDVASSLFAMVMYPLSAVVGLAGAFFLGPFQIAGIITIGFGVFIFILGRVIGEQQKNALPKQVAIRKIIYQTAVGISLVYLFLLLNHVLPIQNKI